MSAPAQKPRPAPVTMMAPIDGSSLAASTTVVSSPIIVGVHAFIRSGRFSVMRSTASTLLHDDLLVLLCCRSWVASTLTVSSCRGPSILAARSGDGRIEPGEDEAWTSGWRRRWRGPGWRASARSTTTGAVRLVPICFAVVDELAGQRRRPQAQADRPAAPARRHRRRPGAATLLIDHYDDDWTQLWWVRVSGRAVVHEPGDPASTAAAATRWRPSTAQYREHRPAGSVYRVAMDELRWWRWTD